MSVSNETLAALLYWAYVGCFVYLLVVYAFYLILAAFSAFENRLRNRQARGEPFGTLLASRFTIPVSVIAPAYNEEVIIVSAVRSLLSLEYSEHEVIVVNDGSTDGTLDRLRDEFELEPRQMFFRRLFPTAPVRAIYRSRKEPRLLVVDKENGGKADALNCGINFARYRYVCCVDADTFYDRKALLHGMQLALRDPARVIAVTSLVEISSRPEERYLSERAPAAIDPHPLIHFQQIDYLRAFLNNRLAWSRFDFMLCVAGVFSIWRRDVVEELGGFSTRFTCEDIELTFRAHRHFIDAGRPYRILSLPHIVASNEGPARVGPLVSQRARWQRVILETVWHYRRMFFNPRYRAVGLVGMPYYAIYEGLAPAVELVSLLTVPLAWWLGVIGWREFFLFLGTMTFANGVLANAAVLLQDRGSRSFPPRLLGVLVLFGAVEFLVYRPILFFARWKGAVGFLRGDRNWYKFERNERPGPGPPEMAPVRSPS